MKLNKARNKIDPAYTEVAVFGHKKGKETFEISCRGKGSRHFWLNVADTAITRCARVTGTSREKIIADFIVNNVAFGTMAYEDARSMLEAVAQALSQIYIAQKEWN